jgi:hypothetical protein
LACVSIYKKTIRPTNAQKYYIRNSGRRGLGVGAEAHFALLTLMIPDWRKLPLAVVTYSDVRTNWLCDSLTSRDYDPVIITADVNSTNIVKSKASSLRIAEACVASMSRMGVLRSISLNEGFGSSPRGTLKGTRSFPELYLRGFRVGATLKLDAAKEGSFQRPS